MQLDFFTGSALGRAVAGSVWLTLITLAGCGGGGAGDSGSRSGVSIDAPLARIDGGAAAAPGEIVTYRVSCQGRGDMSYQWDPGNGELQSSREPTFAYRYESEGEFLPRVTCTDSSGAYVISVAAIYQHISVPVHTITAISAAASAPDATGTEVRFMATCVGSRGDSTLRYAWAFGDGATAQGQNVTHSYRNSEAGQYTAVVSCTEVASRTGLAGQAMDASQTTTASTSVVIDDTTRTPRLERPLEIDPYIPTTAGPTTFSMLCSPTDGGSISYSFDFGDGSPVQVSATGSVSHNYLPQGREVATPYTVKADCRQSKGWSHAQKRLIGVREPELRLLAGQIAGGVAAYGVAVDVDGNLYVSDPPSDLIRIINPAGMVSTLAGSSRGYVNDTGKGASFNGPIGVAVDRGGNVYVVDMNNHAIRKINSIGEVSTLAGGTQGFADGMGSAASFDQPVSVAVDSRGNVYVADSNNHAIRRISFAGVVTTLAGGSRGAVDGVGSAASFYGPSGVAVDTEDNVYVADSGNHAIRKISPLGVVSTLAGGSLGHINATGQAASFKFPKGLTVDTAGNVYVADSGNYAIRKINPIGAVSTLAGGTFGHTNGLGSAATFANPTGVAVDRYENVYVADYGSSIRKISSAGMVSTLVGASGLVDAPVGTAARFARPRGVALDGSGNVYVADMFNNAIRKVSASGAVSTLAGGMQGAADGTGTAASFFQPTGIAVDGSGDMYVADSLNNSIRKVSVAGVVSTLAGDGGTSGFSDGTGASARFRNPSGVAVDQQGHIYVADTSNYAIRKISPSGVVSTLAGGAASGSTDGVGSAASFSKPVGVVVDRAGNVYVADRYTVRKISSTGVVTTLAGSTYGFADGVGSAANFGVLEGIAMDGSGNVYVTDSNSAIRKITSGGVVSTIAGTPGVQSFRSSQLPGAIEQPLGIAIVGRRIVFGMGHTIAEIDYAP